MQEEEEAADAAAKGAKQAAGRKSRKPKKSAKKATRTAASSRAENPQGAATAEEQPATQHAAPCDGALHDPQPLFQTHANADDAVPPLGGDKADDSWQLCPLTKVSYAMQEMSRAT